METTHLPQQKQRFKELLIRYKKHLSLTAAVLIVGLSAGSYIKNERIKAELTEAIAEYQKSLLPMGGEMTYASLSCSGLIWTDCRIDSIRLSLLGQEQLSIGSLRIGDVEGLSHLKAFAEGKAHKASIDIEAREITLPKPLIAQMVAQNVSDPFQKNTLEKLSTLSLALEGEWEGDTSMLSHLQIERLLIDNAIMPIEFSMKAREVSGAHPESMILEKFSFSVRDRAISDVTYDSVKSFLQTLQPEEQKTFLKEFALNPSDMGDSAKASRAINAAIAQNLEKSLKETGGVVEKELLRGMIKLLLGEAERISLEGKNKSAMTLMQVQDLLSHAYNMNEEEAARYMENKFTIDVELD